MPRFPSFRDAGTDGENWHELKARRTGVKTSGREGVGYLLGGAGGA